jgi:hypothetical protein
MTCWVKYPSEIKAGTTKTSSDSTVSSTCLIEGSSFQKHSTTSSNSPVSLMRAACS